MPFSASTTPIQGLFVIEPKVFGDDRGFFMESFKASDFVALGISESFVQDNHSLSRRGVVRGLHFQRAPHAQGKLVRVTRGSVWDVAADLRPGSPTFKKWYGLELSPENHRIFWISEGCAHGFIALEDSSELQYKCTREYHQASDAGIRWDDPDINIEWPDVGQAPILSPKDAALPYAKDIKL